MASLATMEGVQEKIVERIRASFVELIPEEQWRALVEKEIGNFSLPPQNPPYGAPRCSTLSALIQDELSKMLRERVRRSLTSSDFMSNWNGTENGPSAFVAEFIQKNVGIIVQAAIGQMMQHATESLRLSMSQYRS